MLLSSRFIALENRKIAIKVTFKKAKDTFFRFFDLSKLIQTVAKTDSNENNKKVKFSIRQVHQPV